MLVRFAVKHKITTINIVRKQEQEDILKGLGAKNILNSGSPTFAEDLQKLITEFGTKIYFSAIGGGDVPKTVLKLLPDNSHAFQFGRLDFSTEGFTTEVPEDIKAKNHTIKFFAMPSWIPTLKPEELGISV